MSQPPGLSALGCQGSACDRLRLTGGLRALALGSYIVPLRWRGTAPSAPFFIPPLAAKTIQPPCGRRKTGQPRSARGNAFPLWWLAPPPCPVGSMSLDSRVAYSSPMNPVPLPPPQAGHYKAPLCCELLMKGLLCGSLLSHRSAGGRWCRKAPKGEKPPEVADQRMLFMPYDTEKQIP